jgi:hypothetical protein
MTKVMKAYPLELPDDPDIQALFENIYVTNTGHLLVRFREVSQDGIVRPVAVLREMSDEVAGKGILSLQMLKKASR